MKKPIRILHILQRMEAGGTQALLMNLYRNIDRSKIQFDFFVMYPDKYFYDDEIVKLGGKVYYSTVRLDKNIFKYMKKLEEIIKENNYKIVHVHAFTIGYFALKTAKKCKVPVRIAHSHNNQTVKDEKIILKKVLQKIYTIYATDLFACSEEAGKYLFKRKKFNVLNNSIDSMKFVFDEEIRKKVRKNLNIKENEFLVGHIGRLHAQKNHNFLLDVFVELKKKIKESKLLLIGDGPLEEDIKKKIKRLNIEQDVIMLKNRSDVNELYMAMDVFILPSLFEGLGIVAVEAQASGTPCLTADTLPLESNISPLFNSLSLNESANKWADEAIKLSKSVYKHKNMQDYVVKANYDIAKSTKKMETYYIEKYESYN